MKNLVGWIHFQKLFYYFFFIFINWFPNDWVPWKHRFLIFCGNICCVFSQFKSVRISSLYSYICLHTSVQGSKIHFPSKELIKPGGMEIDVDTLSGRNVSSLFDSKVKVQKSSILYHPLNWTPPSKRAGWTASTSDITTWFVMLWFRVVYRARPCMRYWQESDRFRDIFNQRSYSLD